MALMRTILRAVAGAAIVATLAGPAAADQPYRSAEHGFSLTTPTGWTAEPDATGGVIRLRVRADANPRVACNVSVVDHATIKDASQADLDAQLTQPTGEAMIRRDIGSITGATLQTLSVTIVQRGGHPAVNSDLTVAANGESFRIRRLDLFRPGRQYIVNCGGPAEAAQPLSAQFETVLRTFRLN